MGTSNQQNRGQQTDEARLRARFVSRAIETDAPLLAPPLYRYATAEGLTWDELAQSLDCSVDALNQVAICRPPRPEHFVADVETIAAEYIAPDRLLPLLRRLQVTAAFAEQPVERLAGRTTGPRQAILLAARDREDEPEPPQATAEPITEPDPPQSAIEPTSPTESDHA